MFTIYCLTLPDGRAYVGLTSQSTRIKWADGWSYALNPPLYDGILEYGWQHIKKEELAKMSLEKEARDLEAILINRLKTYRQEKGFNTVRTKERIEGMTEEEQVKLLEQYGLSEYVPTPIEGVMELVDKWQEEERERRRIEELRKQARWQMYNWIESLNNPLPIYDDPEYQKIFQEEVRLHKEAEEQAKKARKRIYEINRAKYARSEIEEYEREKWGRIEQQRATYRKWRKNQ